MNLLIKNLSKIKNAHTAKKLMVDLVLSKYTINVLKLLKKEGLIKGFSKKINKVRVFFKYIDNKPVFTIIELVSKPSRQVVLSYDNILKFKPRSSGLCVFTATGGVLTKSDLLKNKSGGTPLFFVR